MQTCPRCKGNIVSRFDEESCLQCGYEPGTAIRFSPPQAKLATKTLLKRCRICQKPYKVKLQAADSYQLKYSTSVREYCDNCFSRTVGQKSTDRYQNYRGNPKLAKGESNAKRT